MFITLLAFPTLLFVTLSRSPTALAADSEVSSSIVPIAGGPPGAADSAGIEMPHEAPTPDYTGKKTLTEKATSAVADMVSGTHHSVYEFKTKSLRGKEVALSDYKKKVAIVVNVASECGYTDVHYRELEQLYKKYKDQGFTVLAFPSNQFGNQEPGTPAEIEKFARDTKHATFPLLEKVEVNGKDANPLFVFLKHKFGIKEIPWNFQKFLIDHDGFPVHQYPSQIDPMAMEHDIQALLHPASLSSLHTT